MSSGSIKALSVGRLTITCFTKKSSGEIVKLITRPSLLPFLVSTLRPMRLKFRSRMSLILTTSLSATSSSMLSTTTPRWEYSRMDEVSRMQLVELIVGPVTRKAMILRVSGSTMGDSMLAMGPLAWTLSIGVPERRELYINISLLYHEILILIAAAWSVIYCCVICSRVCAFWMLYEPI